MPARFHKHDLNIVPGYARIIVSTLRVNRLYYESYRLYMKTSKAASGSFPYKTNYRAPLIYFQFLFKFLVTLGEKDLEATLSI